MIDEFCAGVEDEQIQTMDNLNLLEVMDLCTNLYLSHLLAVEALGYRSEPFAYRNEPLAGSDNEGAWISSCFSFAAQIFFKHGRIH